MNGASLKLLLGNPGLLFVGKTQVSGFQEDSLCLDSGQCMLVPFVSITALPEILRSMPRVGCDVERNIDFLGTGAEVWWSQNRAEVE